MPEKYQQSQLLTIFDNFQKLRNNSGLWGVNAIGHSFMDHKSGSAKKDQPTARKGQTNEQNNWDSGF
jgi:hypothetical protein